MCILIHNLHLYLIYYEFHFKNFDVNKQWDSVVKSSS